MRQILALALTVVAIISGCCRVERKTSQIKAVNFPEPPVEILTNEAVGMDLINYFNIIQLPEGGYRMYFSGYKAEECGPEWDHQNLFKGMVLEYVIEQSVFLTGDKDKPIGLVGRTPENGKLAMFLWKSKDGIEFTDKTLLLTKWHDTQNVMVPRDGRLKLYTRIWHDGWVNRKNAVAEFSTEGGQLTEIRPLSGDFLYNSAASPVDGRYDVLFPTYFNNKYPAGSIDSCYFKCYVVDGLYSKEIPCNLNEWRDQDDKWVLAAPGFIFINGERYLAYNTRGITHDTAPSKGIVSKNKLIKVEIEYE